MTVTELKDLLEQMEEAGLGEREVLFVYQEHYPLQDHIAGGWVPEPASDHQDDDEEDDDDRDDEDDVDESAVYLVSGGQHYQRPYGPRRAFEEKVESL